MTHGWVVGLLLFSGVAQVGTALADDDKGSFCDERSSARIMEIASDQSMRLSFENDGGLGGGGVCWWHSRFQRAMWYLARFQPELPKPSEDQRRKIVRRLASRRFVVEIPGYRNGFEFSKDNQELIQRELNHWQLRDAFINQAYIRGLSGRSAYRNPANLKEHMDSLYADYIISETKNEILWVMLQIQGLASHASLIQMMEPRLDGGYDIEMVDSNFPTGNIYYRYTPGDHTLTPLNGYDPREGIEWIPYVGLGRDYRRIHRAISRYCKAQDEDTPAAAPDDMNSGDEDEFTSIDSAE